MLKVISSVVLSFFIAYCYGQISPLELSSNASLTYEQTINNVKNEVRINISNDSTLTAPKISWSLHSGDKSFSKIYSYSAKGVDNSTILYLKFDESLIPLPDANVMLLSKRSFWEITYGKTIFRVNGGGPTGFVVSGKEKMQVSINGKNTEVETYHLTSIGDTPVQELWILNNTHNPILLKASGVFNLELTEVKL